MPDSIPVTGGTVNGIDVDALMASVAEVQRDPAQGKVAFNVRTAWQGGTRSETTVTGYQLAGEAIERRFVIRQDEPLELLGTNTAPNPQETLMAALNACITVGYVAGCALQGIELESLEIETDGELDLRGFLGLDASVSPGYDALRYVVRIKGSGTPEQFRAIHETVMRTSPNYFNLARPVRLVATLSIAD